MSRIYVTGSSGFLGKHLVSRLGGFSPIFHDDIETIRLLPYQKFYFLSTYGNMSFHNDSKAILRANVSDLITILTKTDWENGVESFVYVSTSSVSQQVQTMYSRSKKAAEEILLSFMEKYNAPIAIVRPFSITGVGEQKEHLIPKLIESCLMGVEMPFVPEARHDFIDVEDVADGIVALSKRHARGIFELGTGKEYSNLEVLHLVEKITKKKANIHVVSNLRTYDSEHWVSANMKARTYGWEPKKTLDQTIAEMVEEYEQTRKKAD